MSQRIVIFGGPDMSGKTEIAKALASKLDITYFKASGEHHTFLHDQDHFINDLRYADPRMIDVLRQTNLSIVMDRGYLCEKVYAQFFDRETDHQMLERIDREYASLGTKIVVCKRASYEGITDDIMPDRLDSKALEAISHLYDEFTSWTSCDTKTLFVDDEDLDRELKEIIAFLDT